MLLTIDIGNTNILFCVFDNDRVFCEARLETNSRITSDQYAAELSVILSLKGFDPSLIDSSIISSVVPGITQIIRNAIFIISGVDSLILNENIKSDLKVILNKTEQLGADLDAGCIGAITKYSLPCLVIDLGTATKICVVDKNGVFRGCVIAPGIGVSLAALSSSASLLPSINLNNSDCPAFGTDTVTCMQAGVLHGTASMIDGLCDRIEKALGENIESFVATGGYAENIVNYCRHKIILDSKLILYGLKAIYDKYAE